jgi:Protein of unknown function (DUF3006)
MTIDRVEGTAAILISCQDESVRVNVPVSLLPQGYREGDILTFRIERDLPATNAARERMSGLIEKLKKRK